MLKMIFEIHMFNYKYALLVIQSKKKKNALLLLMTSHPFQQKQTLQTEPS